MSYMLDTNICIYLLTDDKAAWQAMAKLDIGQVTISSIVYAELVVGARTYSGGNADVQIARFTEQVPVVPFDVRAAEVYGTARRGLARASGREMDRLIAAHALSRSAILVTNNEADFAEFGDLRLLNWID